MDGNNLITWNVPVTKTVTHDYNNSVSALSHKVNTGEHLFIDQIQPTTPPKTRDIGIYRSNELFSINGNGGYVTFNHYFPHKWETMGNYWYQDTNGSENGGFCEVNGTNNRVILNYWADFKVKLGYASTDSWIRFLTVNGSGNVVIVNVYNCEVGIGKSSGYNDYLFHVNSGNVVLVNLFGPNAKIHPFQNDFNKRVNG